MLKIRMALIILIVAMPLLAQTKSSSDISRLSAILLDAQNTKVTISPDAWKVTANEANALARRIAANSSRKSAAKQLQTHVSQMRDAALAGNVDSARSHASQAMPFLYQLSE
jgi:phosphoenolpyruvate-protein kinase (PTS system EI component)